VDGVVVSGITVLSLDVRARRGSRGLMQAHRVRRRAALTGASDNALTRRVAAAAPGTWPGGWPGGTVPRAGVCGTGR
jgi:hypothetical protein